MTVGRPGAAHLGLPFDVQKDPVDEAEVHADPALGAYPARCSAPEPAAIAAAAQAILSAERPLFICGGGPVIAGAEEDLRALAELLEAPVATTISGKGAIAEDHPLALGVVGQRRHARDACDGRPGGRDRVRRLPAAWSSPSAGGIPLRARWTSCTSTSTLP